MDLYISRLKSIKCLDQFKHCMTITVENIKYMLINDNKYYSINKLDYLFCLDDLD